MARRFVLVGTTVLVVAVGCKDGPTGPDGRTLVVTPAAATVQVGDTVRLTATLRDANGSNLPTTGASWTSNNRQVADVSSTGLVSALAPGGPVTITVIVGTSTARAEITVIGGPPSQLSIETQPGADAASGVPLSPQPVIRLRDVDGYESHQPGIVVTAVVAEGEGTLASATATTDTMGRAIFAGLTISGTVGTYRIRFEAPGLDPATSAAVLLSSGIAASVSIDVEPSAVAQSGVAFSTQPRIIVRDADGNAVEGAAVGAAVAAGQGTLGGATTLVTDAGGVVAYTNLSVTGPVGDVTLVFTSGSASAESGTITLEAGPPATVALITQPSSTAQSGVAFDQQPVAEVRDGAGNVVGGVDVDVSVVSGGGTLGGTTTVTTNGLGQASFIDLTIVGSAGEHVLQFQADGASVTSAPISLAAGVPATVTVLTQPSGTAQSGVQFSRQPVVEVRDNGGNPISGANVTVTIASGGGTLGGTATVATNGAGEATFTNLSISGTVGTKRLQFTAGSASAVSNSIDLQAGPLDTLVITQQPSGTATNGEPFPQQPSVTAYDADGNTISGLDVEVGIASGGGTLSGTPTASTNGSGVASFSGLTITGTVGTRTLLFSSAAVESESSSIDVQAGAAASVNITTEPPGFALDGVTFTSSTVVEVRDISNNLVSGAAVLATIASGTGTLGGTTSVATNPSGQASFSNLFIDASESPGDRTLQFASNGAADVSSAVHVAYGEGVYFDVPYCSGNASQLMDVYVPSNTYARPLPMAAYIHGGGWVGGDKGISSLLPGIRDELLSRGYVVVSLNYRLATASTNQWPAQIEDVKCAIRHLRAKAADYGFDGVRIGTWGSSAGAHLAAMLGVTDTGAGFEGSAEYGTSSSRVEAAVPIGVISDLTPAAQSELDFFGPEWTFSDWPNDTGGELTNASPVTWATSDDPPFLIIHADEDIKVYPNQAVRLETALDAVSANVTLQTVANADHPLNDLGGADPSLAQIFEQVGDFFDNWVKGP